MCYRGQMGSTTATREEARTSRFCHGMTTLGARECCCNEFSSSPCAAVGVKGNQFYGEGVASATLLCPHKCFSQNKRDNGNRTTPRAGATTAEAQKGLGWKGPQWVSWSNLPA